MSDQTDNEQPPEEGEVADPPDEDREEDREEDRPSHVESPPGFGRSVTWIVLGAIALAGVVVLALHRARPPARCPDGLIALGPRCCGEGQSLDGDRCTGEPTRCATGMERTPAGCVAEHRRVAFAGGELELMPHDWEAAQKGVAPFEAQVAPFRMDSHEVTEKQWEPCVDARACPSVEMSGEPGRPIVGVTATEAQAYCKWAGGSLPTKAQWAFAAAGSEGRRYPWGETGAVCRRAVFGLAEGPCGEGATRPDLAGAHPDGASPQGLHDLAGNAAEWTVPITKGKHAGKSAVRGGSWQNQTATDLRTWNEDLLPKSSRSPAIGFRCAYAGSDATRPARE